MIACLIAVGGLSFSSRHVTDEQENTVTSRPVIRWLPEPGLHYMGTTNQQYIVAETQDPSLLSLPNPRGFSRQMWKHDAPAERAKTDWESAPAFLEAQNPRPFRSFVDLPKLADDLQEDAEKLEGESHESFPELVELPPGIDQTVVKFLGAIALRTVIQYPSLPTAKSHTPLRPTQVRIAVDPEGTVRFAMVDRSCGNQNIDQEALQISKNIRFDVQTINNDGMLTWGIAKFLWAVTNISDPISSSGNP